MVVSSASLLSQQLDPDMGEKFYPIVKNEGISLHLSTTVTSAESGKSGIKLFLSNGETAETDWILVAKGIVRM